jgi:hypothetical protein
MMMIFIYARRGVSETGYLLWPPMGYGDVLSYGFIVQKLSNRRKHFYGHTQGWLFVGAKPRKGHFLVPA